MKSSRFLLGLWTGIVVAGLGFYLGTGVAISTGLLSIAPCNTLTIDHSVFSAGSQTFFDEQGVHVMRLPPLGAQKPK